MSIKDLEIPEELKDFSEEYGEILLKMTLKELLAWFKLKRKGDWIPAYEILISNMTTEEILESHKLGNENLKKQNRQNTSDIEIQKEMLEEAGKVAVAILKAAIL